MNQDELLADPDIVRILNGAKQIGKYQIWVTEILARHKQAQHPSRRDRRLELVPLSQLVENCRFQSRPPGWLPEALYGRWDAYLVAPHGRLAIGLTRKEGLEYNAVAFLEQDIVEAVIYRGGEPAEENCFCLYLSDHAVDQYLNRYCKGNPSRTEASERLYHLALRGKLLPDFPGWFDDHDYSSSQPSFVILAGDNQAMLPVSCQSHDRPYNLVARTFLFRDMHLFSGGRLPEKLRR